MRTSSSNAAAGAGAPAQPVYAAAVLMTMGVHVPLNDGLKAAGDPDRIADLATVRAQFGEQRWSRWNLVRAVTSTAACACLAWALAVPGRAGNKDADRHVERYDTS